MSEQMNVPGYEHLADVLVAAYNQAARGKGHERHVGDRVLHFLDQPMQTICRMLGSPEGMAYQAVKKIEEAGRMTGEKRRKELLGAIVYVAGMLVYDEANPSPDADPVFTGEAAMPSPSYCPHCHSIPCSCTAAADTPSGKYAGHPCAAPSTLGQWPDPTRCVQCMSSPCRCGYMTGTAPADPHDPYSRR